MSKRGTRAGSRKQGDGWEVWGGYMNAKRQKLQDQFNQEAPAQLKKEGSGSNLFSGISIHVNGYTKPSSDELKRLMMLHGGNYEHYLYRTRVTHVIATNLPNSKVKELKGLKVVRPEWITESIAAGRLLSYSKYLLYTAQTGGIQKGLQTFTSATQLDQSNVVTQSTLHNGNNSELNVSSEHIGACDNESNQSRRASNVDTIGNDTGLDSVKENVNDPNQSDVYNVNNSLGTLEKSNYNAGSMSDSTNSNMSTNLNTSPNSNTSPAKAGDPKFLNEFYSNSRLHFLSTWKAEWKTYVNDLQSKGDNFPAREKLRKIVSEREVTCDNFVQQSCESKKRCVMHIDMDCFFVSVGLRQRPELQGKPVAVTHSRGKGAKLDPRSDLIYERRQRELKVLQGAKKGRKRTSLDVSTLPDNLQGDTSFPDISDSDGSDDNNDVSDGNKTTTTTPESFHSMAEIASCSYEARKAGVKNGMFMGRAKAICPDLVTIPYDFDGYKAVSRILYDTVASYTHDIEAVSCDEMLIDCTDLLRNTGATPLEFSTLLRSEIFTQTGCNASVGIGSSILLARIATKQAKPNGQFHLTEDLVVDYIRGQPVKDLPGVGWSLTKRFEALKVITCGDLQGISLELLQKEFGPKTGQSLYRYCRGIDDRPIRIEQQRKSVSAEVNYGIRFTTDAEAVKFMEDLSAEVCTRLKNIKMKGKTITLKLMVRRKDAPKETSKFMGHGICINLSKSVTLPMATDEDRIVTKETIGLLRHYKVEPEDLRGIGIQVQKLEPAEEGKAGTSKKLPSILNFTVKTKSVPSEQYTKSVSPENVKSNSVHCETGDGVESGTVMIDSTAVNLGNNHYDSPASKLGTNSQDTSIGHLFRDIEENNRHYSKENSVNESVNGHDSNDIPDRSLHVGLEDLSQLPPLPSFPDIRTPESVKKRVVGRNTPDTHTTEVDYFPSPSQVDMAVLNELPPEIREQIENEIGSRKRKKMESKIASKAPSTDAGSYWQQDRTEYSDGTKQTKQGYKVESDRKQPSSDRKQNKGDNHHAEDKIEALPSPSQIDPSCLEALPEFLQAELRQAYAKQNSNRRVVPKGGNTLQLKQAKSPVKSPGKNKRSPGKKSPNFKVPRGRPSGRGRKQSSSKKTLFKEPTLQIPATHRSSTITQPLPTFPVVTSTSHTVHQGSADFIDILTDPDEDRSQVSVADKSIKSDSSVDRVVTHLGESSELTECPIEPESSNRDDDNNGGVSLCGAVTLKDVKILVKEWITSTPVPLQEDEEVLMDYLNSLIMVKNLELVDLVLKFMLRNIVAVNSRDWLCTLKRVYTYIQNVVFQIYGSRLSSITL